MTLINRWYQILEILISQHEVEIDILLQNLGLSQQTLFKSIEQLNDILNRDAEIIQTKDKLQLNVYDYSEIEKILEGSLRKESDYNSSTKRIAYIFKRLIESKTPIFIDDLAEEVSVSRGTIIKDLKEVKKIANEYSIKIVGRPNRGLVIIGTEINLRLIYIHIVYNYFEIDEVDTAFEKLLDEICQNFQLPKKIQDLISKTISITKLRIQNGHYIDEEISYYSNEVNSIELLEEIYYFMEFNYHISLSQYEKDFINFPFNIQYINGLEYRNNFDEKLYYIFKNMTNRVKEKLLVNFDEQVLYEEMVTHLKYLVNRLIFHVQLNDIFHGDIKNKFPLAYEMAGVASKTLEEEFGYSLQLSEKSYLALYFELILRNKDKHNNLNFKKIAVVCTTGLGTANMICRRLTQVLGRDIEINRFSEEQFDPKRDDDYFAIFTTIPLKFGQLKSPVVQITNLFNDQWLQNEWQKVNKYHQKNLETTILRFISLKNVESYQESLIQLSEILFKDGHVDAEFKNRILERESAQSTEFGNKIAFPHTINLLSNKIILFLAKLENKIIDEGKQVEFIFMVAIPNKLSPNTESDLLELYDDIFRISSSESLKNDLRKIEDEQQFIDFTKEKGVF